METMTHESHGLCFCGIGAHCSGGEFCDGECPSYRPVSPVSGVSNE